MEGSPKQEALLLIRQAEEILIPLSVQPDEDSIGSALALKLFLEKLGKRVTLLSLDPLPQKVKFMPCSETVVAEIPGSKDFVIHLKTDSAAAEKLSYHLSPGQLHIIVTAKEGQFKPEDVTFAPGRLKVNLIITVDTPSLARLGELPASYPELFNGEVPILNIDHHASNDFFGRVNLVDPAAAATSEILISLLESINRELIDEEIATSLLASLWADTASFQNANTTPKALTVAAQLLGFGANHSEVVRHLFKSKAFSTLKLWGRALHRLAFNSEIGLVWTKLVREDFEETGAQKDETSGLIDELLKATQGAKVALLLKEYEKGKLYGSLRSAERGVDVLKLAQSFGGGGHLEAAGFELEGSGEEWESKVLKQLSAQLTPAPPSLEEKAELSLE